jgi:hypothetical protein
MEKILKEELYETVHCPCGTTVKRYNYAHHCSFPKHKAWSRLMPSPERLPDWTTKPLDEDAKERAIHDRTNGFSSR